jgi:hypothetical protein
MQTKTEVSALFDTTLERAFKTPMLCDITKVHTGYGFTPKATHCTEDESWGKVGGSRKVHLGKSLTMQAGETTLDKVLARVENHYWKIEISEFTSQMFGFEKFQGEWITVERPDGKIQVRYIYTLFSNSLFFYPFHFLFTKLVWRNYMKHTLENIRQLALNHSPYLSE